MAEISFLKWFSAWNRLQKSEWEGDKRTRDEKICLEKEGKKKKRKEKALKN